MNCRENLENQQCRTCYNATKGLKLLTNLTKCAGEPQQKSYAELLTEISNINVMEDPCKELPQFICDVCLRKLKGAHAFIQQIHEVNRRLLSMLGASPEDTNRLVDCLQEAPVDIQSCLEIKMEHTSAVAEEDSVAKCNLKLEETEELVQSKHLDVDVLGERFNDVGSIATVGKGANRLNSNLKSANVQDIFNSNSTNADNEESKSSLKLPKDLFNPNEDKSESDDDKDVDDNFEENEMDWQTEKDNTPNIKRQEKINSKKSKKSEPSPEKLPEDDDVAVPCSQCNKIFGNAKALARHQRTSHIPEDQKCTCPLCFRKFSRSCNMYTHMRTFHGPDTVPLIRKPSTKERIFQCDKCPRNYTKKKHLNIHIKNKHIKENEDSEKNNEKCTEDKKESADDDSPVKPQKPKRYEVRSLCSICGSSFSSKTHLIVHMRRHTGERPFKCDLCDRAYPRISELTCHRRIHTGEKPFACKICGKTFRVSSKMTTHMRSHTDIRPYKCTQCERSFKYSKDLSIHFRIHTGERPYCCNVCGSTFTQSNTLKAHRVKLGHMDNMLENN